MKTRKPRVLIIDDEEALRIGLQRILTAEGYEAIGAANGSEGIQTAGTGEFDLVLIDLKMPDMSGTDVLRAIRKQSPSSICYIVTAYASYESAIESTRLGADGYILKPFTPEELLDHLRSGYQKRILLLEAEELKREREERLLEVAFERTRLNTIIHSLADGVLVVNIEGEVVYCNNAAMSILSLQDLVIGKPILEELPDEIRTLIFDKFIIEKQNTAAYSVQFIASHNKELYIEATLSAVKKHDGSTGGVVVVLKNISTLKKLDAVKSQFVSMVAHELKAPVSAVISFLDIILTPEAAIPDEQRSDYLHRSRMRLQSLLSLVNDLLDISRMELNKTPRELVPVSITEVITEVLQLFVQQIREKNLQVFFDGTTQSPALMADKQEMLRLFTNLISNAIKYNKQSGSISVSVQSDKHYIYILLRDTGIGIKAEDLPKLFTEFYRAKNEWTRGIHGTGLGLALVKRLVEAYAGSITAKSVYLEGTEFEVRLPYRSIENGESIQYQQLNQKGSSYGAHRSN